MNVCTEVVGDGDSLMLALSANLAFRRAVHYCAVDFEINFADTLSRTFE